MPGVGHKHTDSVILWVVESITGPFEQLDDVIHPMRLFEEVLEIGERWDARALVKSTTADDQSTGVSDGDAPAEQKKSYCQFRI